MRFRHIFSETFAGLRQNLTMTLAVVMTMWVSLSLFGAGLLANQQVGLMKGRWYDKIEISIFFCTPQVGGENCTPGQGATEVEKDAVRQTLEANPEVAPGGVYFESKQEAWAEFQKAYEGNPIQDSLTVEEMQESFRVKLKNPEEYQGVVSAVSGLKGVQKVQDLRQYLDPFFSWLNLLQWGTIVASALLLLAAALQIGNTIRLAAFARRREIGIMRLVGASNLYITLPFLFEAIISALIGVMLASATLVTGVYLVIMRKAEVSIQSLPWIGWKETLLAVLGVAVVGLALSIIPTLITTRKYLRV
ncbi:cell division protein FtsX [Microlunatus phosphovorus NM-1]|uniref:Cell division protein FtsX n=1 Tax=Microlunatus phosphovorus (strain ATCC 700054 / DSM 10555 / JCM 9379 / NBRC 101784 / NCIMB 13414 / VKM Ac-1990 / NM-1) TaxID=1032480 RepID=F5XLN6_MICPN|nr:permease-like cell division protein FtsX [Microlunatus phosphovorus]BAK36302.1 cell division protein FtsX [Microlunatus phosphovorus NM-1]